nr:immunoglobulin light chain junction region [Macaca mulatta]MOW35185.1 immunoglobulin light chain junction region [Macaca mulatta]MOW35744.1 immunoglobulin light chain junction region [Macaca mulatta]
CLHYYGTPLTF